MNRRGRRVNVEARRAIALSLCETLRALCALCGENQPRIINRKFNLPTLIRGLLACLCFISLITNQSTVFAQQAKSASEKSVESKNRIVSNGVAVEMSVEPASKNKQLVEGNVALVQFRISDAATGTAISNAQPAAWMNLRKEGQADAPADCMRKAADYLSGSLLTRPTVDLNSYYVLALNDDATVSVVDPLFGFGGTKLLAMLFLKSAGEDWALTQDQSLLFVSMPDSNQVAVADATAWKVITNLDVGPRPTRLALQGKLLWVAYGEQGSESGVAVVDVSELKLQSRIALGRGKHEIAFSSDNRYALATSRDDCLASIIDAAKLEKIADVKTGGKLSSIAFSPRAQLFYVTDEASGDIIAIDASRQKIVSRIKAEPGIAQIRLAPDGRFAFVANSSKNLVHILDATTNRIIQTADIDGGPDQITFTSNLAYVRRRASEIVLMIPLAQIGQADKPVPVVDFPGGQLPFGKTMRPALADTIVQAPDANAVLVANPADKAIYYYKEGMAAPMGSFSNYSREPRAVMVVDRSLKETAPGIYSTVAKLNQPGAYSVVFFLDSPRVVHCFEVEVAPREDSARVKKSVRLAAQSLMKERTVRAGEKVRLRIKLTDADTGQPLDDLQDVVVLTFLAPGIWQKRHAAQPAGGGVYEIEFTPPQAGVYYIYVESASAGLSMNNAYYFTLEAASAASSR